MFLWMLLLPPFGLRSGAGERGVIATILPISSSFSFISFRNEANGSAATAEAVPSQPNHSDGANPKVREEILVHRPVEPVEPSKRKRGNEGAGWEKREKN